MKNLPKCFLLFLILTIGLLFIDLISKYLFFDLQLAQNLIFINPVLNSWISRSIPVHSIISIVIAIFALGFFIWLYIKKYIWFFVTSLLIAGTIWNMIDRILLWGVRDFLMPFDWFPIFNLADVFLNLWIIVYLRKEFFTWKSVLKH